MNYGGPGEYPVSKMGCTIMDSGMHFRAVYVWKCHKGSMVQDHRITAAAVIQTVPAPANRKPDSLVRIKVISFPANARASLEFGPDSYRDWIFWITLPIAIGM